MNYMAIIENIINVLVPLLICGLIFIYFRRRITNLEQSVDIIMKMLQTNQLNSGGGTSNSSAENTVVTPDDVYVPSHDVEIKRVEMNLEENNDDDDDEEESSESESEEESSSSDSETEPESSSVSETEEQKEKLSPIQEETSSPIQEEDGSLIENEVSSFLESSNIIEETLSNTKEESKTILLSEDISQKEQLEKKTLNELKKLLKEKNPDVNNLSRMNKATVIENLMN